MLGVFGFFRGATAGAPFVPTEKTVVELMISVVQPLDGKKIYDIGCGDGRIVFAAEKAGAIAIGIEISYTIYLLACFRKWMKRSKAILVHQSLWDADLSDADVIFVYLLPKMMQRFEKEVVPKLKPSCRIVSHGFTLPNKTPLIQKELSSFGLATSVLVYTP